jgi:hypothetical protein
MASTTRLSDYQNPTVSNLAIGMTHGKSSLEKVESIFNYVRDEIKFGFPRVWDQVPASETVYYGIGYCNTKATLFVAMCRAVGIPARLHFGLIDIQVMHGILPSFVFPLLPKLGGHSWSEVQLDGEWKSLDSYIDDKAFYERAAQKLKKSGRAVGYSVSTIDGKSSCEFNFGEKGFVHMGAVRQDHGTWEDAADYFASDKYVRFSAWQKPVLPLVFYLANRKITRLRQSSFLLSDQPQA